MDNQNFFKEEDNLDILPLIKRYLKFWPWFLLSLLITLGGAYFYLRYAKRIYQTSAKIKILDESEGLELPTSAFIFKRVNINLENEVEILKSYLILEKVVKGLDLTSSIFEEGTIKTSQVKEMPFNYEQLVDYDTIKRAINYGFKINKNGLEIIDSKGKTLLNAPKYNTYLINHKIPFELSLKENIDISNFVGRKYYVRINPVKSAVMGLKGKIKIEAIGDQSDILLLTIKGENRNESERILNKLIEVFNDDGIKDRQLVSERTVEFIDKRFVFLARELDSIEVSKQDFKKQNNLVDIQSDAELGLQLRSQSDDELFRLESQIALASSLNNVLNKSKEDYSLLPADIGIESPRVNAFGR